MEKEQEDFLKDLTPSNGTDDNLEAPITEAEPEKEPEAKEEETNEQEPRNRRERRLMSRLQEERESSRFLAGKLEARSEAAKAISEESDYLKSVERIYGTDTPEAQLATDLLKKAITGARDEAKRDALAELRSEREKEQAQVKHIEGELDTMLEEIEDEYGVTLTPAQERSYFQLLEKMSPKDRDGNVKDYADAHAVWEVFQEKLNKPKDSRAKDLSSRSMQTSGNAKVAGTDNATEKYLKEQGII